MVNTIWEVYANLRRAGQTAETNPLVRLGQTMLWQGTFHGRFEDKAYAIELFEQHIARVKAELPREGLLLFDVKQGWDPLCRFLDVPVPDKAFPHLNDTEKFRIMVEDTMATAPAQTPEPATHP